MSENNQESIITQSAADLQFQDTTQDNRSPMDLYFEAMCGFEVM